MAGNNIKGAVDRLMPGAERALALLAVLWLQLVGVVTHSVLHHVLHALPLAGLLVLPRTPWVRHTTALVGFAWVVMLSLMTPMIHDALTSGIVFTLRGRAYTWLAPGMVIICAAWTAMHVAILAGRPRRWPGYGLVLVACAVVLALTQPQVYAVFETPLQRVLDGHLVYLLAVLLEVPLVLGLPWVVLRRLTCPPRPPVTLRALCWQSAYWLVFVACMVTGLLPILN